MNRPCFVCGDPQNHGWQWRTDCEPRREWVENGELFQPQDMPSNIVLVCEWEPVRRARAERAANAIASAGVL